MSNEYASNIEECDYLYTDYCPGTCVELICDNYRCDIQNDDSHTCQSCIGTGTRSPPDCECTDDNQVDMYPIHEDCQDPDANITNEGDLTIDENDLLNVYHYNQYMPICGGENFDELAATIACNQMGKNSYKSFEPKPCLLDPQEQFDYTTEREYELKKLEQYTWFNFENCDGSETKIEDCQRSQYQYYYCAEYEYCINLQCFNLPPNDGQIRMNGGVENKQSIVEMIHYDLKTEQSYWKPVCDYSIGDELAHVMCVQQGFKTFKTYFGGQECPKNSNDEKSTEFWFGRLICNGTETKVTKCRYPDSWEQTEYPCKCILLQCTNDFQKSIEGQVRISNNAIEIYHDNQWGQVCTNKPLENIGNVVCNQLRKKINYQVVVKIGTIRNNNAQKQQFTCPNYTNFWISDVECPTGKESSLTSCNINSEWGKHSCKNTDCIYLSCDGEYEADNLFLYQENDLKLNDDGIVMILHNNIWKPISDSGNEYDPENGYYGLGINKASAHVICKQMGQATYKSFETQQDCGENFDGYWLGNIMCKGSEINLVECYHLPWGETLSGDNSNHCVKIECSATQTCVGNNKITTNKYPYCTCKDGYYEDGIQTDCLKCSSFCKTCIFSADNCIECSDSQANYQVLDYQKWHNQQSLISENRRILDQEDSEQNNENGQLIIENINNEQNKCQEIYPTCLECNLEYEICTKCQINYDLENFCMFLYPSHHEKAPCVHISPECIKCKGDYCYECQPGYLSDYNCSVYQDQQCKQIGEHCISCDIISNVCFECEQNYDLETNCNNLLPIGHYLAPCLKYSQYCLECNESKCTKCIGTWDPKYNCQTYIPIEEQCIQSKCKNCNGYSCSDEVYQEDPDAPQVIVEFENQVSISLDDLTPMQKIIAQTVNSNGQLVSPTEEFIDTFSIYTCSLYCGEGYYKEKDGTCQQCSGKCKYCVDTKDNCIICKYEDNPYVGQAPNCDCLPGSKVVGSKCEECSSGFYSFEKNVLRCNKCPDFSNCSGGKEINLNKGFWRENEFSADIEFCQNNENACLGGPSPDPKQQCLEGHKGALCEVCDLEGDVWGEKYANSADFECAQCKKVDNNTLKIIGINILQFVGMFLSVNGTIQAVQDKIKFNSLKNLFDTHEPTPDESGILMKILNNYLFILGVLTTFQLEVPQSIGSFNSGVSNPNKQMSHSFDCFLDSFNLGIPVLYLKVFWQISMGIFQLIFVFMIIGIGKKFKKIITPFKSAIFTTLIYQFISMQPGVITMILETVACREIAGERYILSNTTKKCEGSEYFTYTFLIMLPVFFVLGALVPYLFYQGLKNCHDHDLEASKNKQDKITEIENQKYQEVKYIESDNNQIKKQKLSFKQKVSKYFQNRKIQKQKQKKLNQELKKQKKEQKNKIDDNHQKLDRQKELDQRKVKENYLERSVPLGKYGYLYLEYRTQAYWWEFVKIYQRILIAMTLSFYYNDIKVKGIIVFLIVFFYTVLSIRFRPYRLESHNRIDVISGAVTGVSLILGIFIYQNYYEEWVIIAAILMFLLNIYFIILMITKIIYGKVKLIVTKTNQKIEEKEQIELFDKKMKERQSLINQLKELDNAQKNYQILNVPNNEEKQKENEQKISQYNKQIIEIEEELYSLEFLPKNKTEELTKAIEELPSFILQRGFEENIIQEQELYQRTSQINNLQQNQSPKQIDQENTQISKIPELNNEEEESNQEKQKSNQNIEEDNKQIQNEIIQEKIKTTPDTNQEINQTKNKQNVNKITNKITMLQEEQYEPEMEDSISDSKLTQNDIIINDDNNNITSNNNKNMSYNYVDDNQLQEKQEKNQKSPIKNKDQVKIEIVNNNNNNQVKTQISVQIKSESENFTNISKKQKLKSRQMQSLSLPSKKDYEYFNKQREIQLKNQKPNKAMQGVQKIGESILSLFIGKTNAEDMRKAKYLRQIIKLYFKNLIVDGYNANLIQLATIDQINNNNTQTNTTKTPITKILNGTISKEEQQNLYLQILEFKKIQEWQNKQILQQLSYKMAKRLKNLKYDKKIWEEKLKEYQQNQEEKYNFNNFQSQISQISQFNISQYKKIIEEKVNQFKNKLSNEDIEQQYTSFKLFDEDSDKIVTGEDIKLIMDKLGQNVSKKDLDNMINQVDSNENGEVDFCEFLALISSKEDTTQEKHVIREIFNYYCSQSNGKLDYLDIDNILRNIFKIEESKAVLKEIIRGIDQYGPTTLDIVSFLRLIY